MSRAQRADKPRAVLAQLADGGVVAALCYNLPDPPSPSERNPEYAAKLRAIAQKGDSLGRIPSSVYGHVQVPFHWVFAVLAACAVTACTTWFQDVR